MYVLFDKILVDLRQKILFMQLRKNLQKKELGNVIAKFISY